MKQNAKCSIFFFFNDTATTEIYTLSLHDALPISEHPQPESTSCELAASRLQSIGTAILRGCKMPSQDRKSTRLNSSHGYISYAVFCLKKKKTNRPAVHRRRSVHVMTLRGSKVRSA